MKKCNIIGVALALVRDVINPEIRIYELLLVTDGKYKWH